MFTKQKILCLLSLFPFIITYGQPIKFTTPYSSYNNGSEVVSCDTLPNSNFIIAIRDYNSSCQILMRLDSLGSIIWQKQALCQSTDTAVKAEVAYSGGFIYYSAEIVAKNGEIFRLTKLDLQGNISWVKDFHTNATNFKNATLTDFNGGILLGGGGCSGNNFILRIDGDGNIAWQKQFLTSSMWGSQVLAMGKTKIGHFLVASESHTNQNINTAIIYKIDLMGNVLWMKELMIDSMKKYSFYPSSIKEDKTGNIYLIGHIMYSPDGYQVVLKVDADGNLIYLSRFLNTGVRFGDLFFDNDENPVIIGTGCFNCSTLPITKYGFYMKLDKTSGQILDQKKIINQESNPDSVASFNKAIKLGDNRYAVFGNFYDAYFNIINGSQFKACKIDTLAFSLNTFNYTYTNPSVTVYNVPFKDSTLVNYNLTNSSVAVNTFCSTLTVGIKSIATSSIVPYPNPTHSFITIPVAVNNTTLNYSIMNTYGQIVEHGYKSSKANNIELDLRNYVTGIYFISIETSKEKTISKILKIE